MPSRSPPIMVQRLAESMIAMQLIISHRIGFVVW
jgi:hypothetical protein